MLSDLLGRCATRKLEGEPLLREMFGTFGPLSPGLSSVAAEVGADLLRKGAVQRPLFGTCLVAVAAWDSELATQLWRQACALPSEGLGLITAGLAASIPMAEWDRVQSSSLGGRSFALRVARASLGDDASAAALPSLVARVPEVLRVELVREVLPLLAPSWRPQSAVAQAMWLLARQERHTGRWLAFADIAARGGVDEPLRLAAERASEYTGASADTWCLVDAWLGRARGALKVAPKTLRIEALRKILAMPSASTELRLGRALLDAKNPGMMKALEATLIQPKLEPAAMLPWMWRVNLGAEAQLQVGAVATRALSKSKSDAQRGMLALLLSLSGEEERGRDVADELLRSRSFAPRMWSALVRVLPRDQLWTASLPLWDAATSPT